MFKHFCRPRTGMWIAIAVAVFAACLSGHHAKAATPYPDANTERFSVTVTGSGPDILLIPGLASSGAVWDSTVTHLKDHYRLHVLNLAGFAGEPSGANANGPILAPSVEAIDAYIKANHLKAPIVVGHSLGGLMALMLAKAHPEDSGKLVIIDALPYVGLIFNPSATVETMKPTATALRDGMATMSDDAFKAQQTAGTARLVSSPDNQKTVLDWSVKSDRHVFAQSFYEDLTTDLRADMAAIKTQITLIYPIATAYGQSIATTEPLYKSAYSGTPSLTLVHIDNSLHFEMLDQPDAFNSALDAALK